MKQEEKNRISRERILPAAFAEFGAHGYLGASINTVCANGRISKGLLYHYYADKDTLYLACVNQCFQELTAYLSGHLDVETVTLDQYFDVRLGFFREHPLHQRLFCGTVADPPAHLKQQLSDCRREFDALNEAMFTAILKKERLAEGVSLQDAIWQFRLLGDFFNTYLKANSQEIPQPEEYDRLCRQTLHTMLYGLIGQR